MASRCLVLVLDLNDTESNSTSLATFYLFWIYFATPLDGLLLDLSVPLLCMGRAVSDCMWVCPGQNGTCAFDFVAEYRAQRKETHCVL